MKTRLILTMCMAVQSSATFAQIGTAISASRRQDWSIAGVNWTDVGYNIGDAATTFDSWYDVTSNPFANLDKTGATPCDAALSTIISSLNPNHFVLLYFPEGTYLFNQNINITRSNLVLRGANPWYTTIKCNSITVKGSGSTPYYLVTNKTSNSLTLSSPPTNISVYNYVEIAKKQNLAEICPPATYHNNYSECVAKDDPPGSEYHYGQISQVNSVIGSTIGLQDQMGIDYLLDIGNEYQLKVKKINPVQNVGIEDLRLINNPGGVARTYTVEFDYTVNCWISGVESYNAAYHHFGISKSAKATVSGCYVHYVHNPNSDGYGIWLGRKSTNCLIENNIFVHCRHGIVLSESMPHKNVIAYNYSNLSDAISGENILLHGFNPNCTLFEGNVSDWFQSDAYWGYQGKFNTNFRNWYIKFENFYSRYSNVYGNRYVSIEPGPVVISNTNMLYANNNSSSVYTDISYYRQTRPDFLPDNFTWPVLGPPTAVGQPISNTNPAEERFTSGGQFTVNPRDGFTGYSIENYGLISGFNGLLTNNDALIYRNKNYLSIGHHKFYENTTGYWDIGPMTTSILNTLGAEEILTSYNNTDGGTAIYRSTNKTNPPVLLLSQANSKVTAIVAGDFDGNGIDEYFTAITEGTIPKLYKSNTITNLKQTLFYTGTSGSVISCLAAGDVDGNIVGGDNGEELFIGINSGNITRIYRNNNASSFTSGSSIIYENTNGYWDISALACGDFDGDGDDELIEGFNSDAGAAIYKSENGDANVVNIHSGMSNLVIRALAAGDLDLDGDEELVSGFFNSATLTAVLYKSEDASPAREVIIYDRPGKLLDVSSLAIEKSTIRSMNINLEEDINQDKFIEKKALAFPNPSTGSFYIQVLGGLYPDAAYKVFNAQGQEITSGLFNQDVQAIDLDQTVSGMLIVQIINGTSSEFIKVIVQQ